jgi:predicted nucleotidyltransferase
MASGTKQLEKGPAISRAQIREFVKDVVAKFDPSKVILFGSYAYGKPNSDSDVDLLVVMPHHETGPKVAARIMLECSHRFPVDLLVRSPVELRQRLALGDSFLREIVSKGVVLHEDNNR